MVSKRYQKLQMQMMTNFLLDKVFEKPIRSNKIVLQHKQNNLHWKNGLNCLGKFQQGTASGLTFPLQHSSDLRDSPCSRLRWTLLLCPCTYQQHIV